MPDTHRKCIAKVSIWYVYVRVIHLCLFLSLSISFSNADVQVPNNVGHRQIILYIIIIYLVRIQKFQSHGVNGEYRWEFSGRSNARLREIRRNSCSLRFLAVLAYPSECRVRSDILHLMKLGRTLWSWFIGRFIGKENLISYPETNQTLSITRQFAPRSLLLTSKINCGLRHRPPTIHSYSPPPSIAFHSSRGVLTHWHISACECNRQLDYNS